MFRNSKNKTWITYFTLTIFCILILPKTVSAAPSLKLSGSGWFPNVVPGKTYFVDVTVLNASGKAPNPSVTINFEPIDSVTGNPISTVIMRNGGACKTDPVKGTCGVGFDVQSSHSGNFSIRATEGYPPPPSIYPPDTLGPISVANSILLSTTSPNIQVGQNSNVVANLPTTTKDVNINFAIVSSSSGQGTLSPSPCKTGLSGNCNANFTASAVGTYTITASATGYTTSPALAITVTATGSPPPTTNPTPAPINKMTTYTPLAPLPDPFNPGSPMGPIDVSDSNAFSKYLNTIIMLIIGIAAVLAVVMIVLGGIEWMSESVYHKAEGKKRIWEAILGLLLALAAWAILNTIDPALLKGSLAIGTVTVSFEDETEDINNVNASNYSSSAPSGAVNLCTEGISRVSTPGGGSFAVCNRIAPNVQALINLAWSQGFKLGGWGYRSNQQQVNLRIKNCNGDISTKPASQCTPPTARPGSSRHESGLAIDFTCDGQTIQHKTNRCFVWLSSNAKMASLLNLPSEAWHWSIDGK